MIPNILVGGALLLRLITPVAAVPHFVGRDDYCTATVTVHSDGSSASLSSSPNTGPQTVTVVSTVTITSTIEGSSSPTEPAPSAAVFVPTVSGSAASDPETVTVMDTLTVTSTIYATSKPDGPQTTASSEYRTVTMTVTSVLTSVETQTLVQTKTITQDRTVVQTITQTLAQADSTQSAIHGVLSGPSDEDPEGTSVVTWTLTSTTTTTTTVSTPVSGQVNVSPDDASVAGVPPQPTVSAHYRNGTNRCRNGTNTYYNANSAVSSRLYDQSITDLPPASTAARYDPSTTNIPPVSTTTPVVSIPSASPSYSNSSASGYENGLYFVNWGIYQANFQPQSLPASSLTRVYYAFADIGSDGTVQTSDSYADTEKHYPTDSWGDVNATSNAYGCVKQLFLLKRANRNLKVLLSIGGWTYSSKFAPVAADPVARQTFATSAVALVTDYGFDGVDIDWEFNAYAATAADAQNIILLLQLLRSTFDAWAAAHAPGYHFLVTVASPAGPATYTQWDLAAMDPFVDAWNLMAYDYAGAWAAAAGHASNVFPLPGGADNPATPYNTDQAVTAYLDAGVAPAKLHLGLPLYGRSFEGTAGLGESFSGVGAGDGVGAGQWRLKNLPKDGAEEFYDGVAWAAYSYDSATEELISYDNVRSTTAKSQYLKSRGLGGAMFWEASDDRNGSDSLVATMAGLLGALDGGAVNLLEFPTSKYSNIRSGMD